ncbi:MAG: hypothetical protein U0802_23375 [Candidatus Binatia bacterium]
MNPERHRDRHARLRAALASWPAPVAHAIDGDWLELRTDLPACSDVAPAALLRRNRRLPGGVRCVLVSAGRLQCRGEVPLDLPDDAVWARLDGARAGFLTLLDGQPPAAPPAVEPGRLPAELAARLGEAGWPWTARGDGSIAVDLGVADLFLQAEIEAHAGALCGAVALAPFDPEATAAPALLLLRAGGAVRQARPVLSADGVPRLEVVLTADPGARELGHALAALAVACRLCAREIEVLSRAPRIAARVGARLAGGGAADSSHPTPNQSKEEDESWQRQQQR